MKKTIYLLAPLMLVSCNGTTPSQDVKFLIQESSVTLNDRTIVIHLDWEPSSDIIEFSNFSFMLKNQSDITSTVTLKDVSARPLELTNTFNQTLENDDTGSLTFHYHDKTIKKEGEGKVENINIALSPYVEKPIKIVTTDADGGVTEITHEYDESYRLIKSETKKYEEGQLVHNYVDQSTYNDHDDVTHYILTIDGEEVMNTTDTYEYDKNGNMILDCSKGSYYEVVTNTKDAYQYDELNRVTLHEYYSADTLEAEPVMVRKYEYTYTEGKQYQEYEKEVYYDYNLDPSGETPSETTTQTFDDKGDLTSTIILDENSVEIYKTTYTFDEYHCMNNRISEAINISKIDYTTTYYKNNPDKPLNTVEKFYDLEEGEELLSTYTTTYTYDSHDRIKTETLDEDGSISITTYYYEFE